MLVRECHTCKYFSHRVSATGYCHRYPPMLPPIIEKDRRNIITKIRHFFINRFSSDEIIPNIVYSNELPITWETNTCGEWLMGDDKED